MKATLRELEEGLVVLDVRGDVDVGSRRRIESQLAQAVRQHQSIVVDLAECTFTDVGVLRSLRAAHQAAVADGLGFAVVLPFSVTTVVRRLALELTPELVPYPVLPSQQAAIRVARTHASSGPGERGRLLELRSEAWLHGQRREELLAQRDALIMDSRRLRSARRERLPSVDEV